MDASTAPAPGDQAPRGAQPASAADQVYARAKRAILTRHYAANDLITEGELAAASGVSRTPVREALLRLQAEGLVRLLPKRGALVLAATPREAADVMQLRRLFELFAIRQAMTRPRAELVARLTAEMGRMRAAVAVADVTTYVSADRAFHAAIIGSVGNAMLTELYLGLRDRQLRMGLNLFEAADMSTPLSVLPEHQAILDAIESGSVEDAEAAICGHLDRFRYA